MFDKLSMSFCRTLSVLAVPFISLFFFPFSFLSLLLPILSLSTLLPVLAPYRHGRDGAYPHCRDGLRPGVIPNLDDGIPFTLISSKQAHISAPKGAQRNTAVTPSM